MTSILLTFLLFLLAFVIAPFGTTPFETPKVIVSEIAIITLFLLVFFKKDGLTILSSQKMQRILFFGILVLSALHLLFFRSPISFFGNAFRMQGIFLLWLLLLFSFISTHIVLPKLSHRFFLALILLQFLASLFVATPNIQRGVGTLGEPNALAAYAIFLWPFFFFSLEKKQKKRNLILAIGIIVTFLTILVSGSRSGLVALLIQATFMVLHSKLKISFAKSVLVCIVLLALSFLLPFIEQGGVYEKRSEVWQTAFFSGLQNPLLGGGFGNTELLLRKSSQILNNNIQFQFVDSSHNVFLDWWVQGGIVGITLFTLLIFLAFKTFIMQQKKRECILMLGILTVLSFNPGSTITLIQFWWLIGQGCKVDHK